MGHLARMQTLPLPLIASKDYKYMHLAIIECDMQLIYAIFKTFVRLQEHLPLLRHEKLSQLLYVHVSKFKAAGNRAMPCTKGIKGLFEAMTNLHDEIHASV